MRVYAMYLLMSYYDHAECLLMVKYKFTSIMFSCILLLYMPRVFAMHLPKFMEARSVYRFKRQLT